MKKNKTNSMNINVFIPLLDLSKKIKTNKTTYQLKKILYYEIVIF